MGLVHHEQGDVERRDPFHRAVLGQLLRGEEEERRPAAFHRLPGPLLLGGAVRGVDCDGAAGPRRVPQPVQLVLLQGDQRGHDDGGPLLPAVQQEGGHLVDGRLPVAGGHHGEDVPAGGKGAHPGELAVAEVGKAKGDVREPAEVGVVVWAGSQGLGHECSSVATVRGGRARHMPAVVFRVGLPGTVAKMRSAAGNAAPALTGAKDPRQGACF